MKKITNFFIFLAFAFLAFSFNPTKAMNDEVTPLLQATEEQEPTITNLTKDEMLEGCMRIKEKTVINGNGHTLYLGNGRIVVENAELILENVTIKGLKETNILCVGPNSKITILGNVTWLLCGNYKFLNGSFHVLENSQFTIIKDPEMQRTVERTLYQFPYFGYFTSEVSGIANNAKLIMSDITFFYNPSTKPFTLDDIVSTLFPTKSTPKIILEAKNSTLSLNNILLLFSITPLKLTTGTLELANNIHIVSRVKNSLILGKEGSSLKVNFIEKPVTFMSKIKTGKGQYQEIDPIYMIKRKNVITSSE